MTNTKRAPEAIRVYHEWMLNFVLDPEEIAESVTLRMQQDFPKDGLRRFRGVYKRSRYRPVAHWWLERCGVILDPVEGCFCYPGFEYSREEEVKP